MTFTPAHVLAIIIALGAQPARACYIGCRPGETAAHAVINNLLTKRFKAPFKVLSYVTTRTADFDLIAGEMRGYEIFFRAVVEFPEGANPDCAPGAAHPGDDCSGDAYFSLIRETRPTPGRQYIEPGGTRVFDEDLRFAELKDGWKGPDGALYSPE